MCHRESISTSYHGNPGSTSSPATGATMAAKIHLPLDFKISKSRCVKKERGISDRHPFAIARILCQEY